MLQPLPQRMAEAIYQEKPDMPGYTQSMSWLKDLSHTGRRWLSQQLTLMCLLKMTWCALPAGYPQRGRSATLALPEY
ncbi:hypothetical protein U9Z68_21385 [Escherichia coli]